MTINGSSGIQKVTVVGAGTLGTQIALQSAITGHDVTVLARREESLQACRAKHEAILRLYVAREAAGEQARGWAGISSADRPAETVAEETLARITYTTSAEKAMEGCELVSESVPEHPDAKRAVYAELCKHASPSTILTTNSSTLLPSDFMDGVDLPSRFLALHFANGIWDANIGEVMPHPGTDPDVTAKVLDFAKDINMVPFNIGKEQNGYLINSLAAPWLNAATTLVANGVASAPSDVDKAWLISTGGVNGQKPGSVLGPFMMMDKIGLPLLSGAFTFKGNLLQDEQMKKNGLYLKENYVDKGKLGILGGNPLTDKAEGIYTYPNPEYMNDDFLSP